jgi:hypothetical protein
VRSVLLNTSEIKKKLLPTFLRLITMLELRSLVRLMLWQLLKTMFNLSRRTLSLRAKMMKTALLKMKKMKKKHQTKRMNEMLNEKQA